MAKEEKKQDAPTPTEENVEVTPETKKEVTQETTKPQEADVAAVMANMQQEIARLQQMVGEVGDRSRIDRFLKKEQAERERAGQIDRTCFVQMFNNKFVLSWSNMRPTDNRVYVNPKGQLVEEIVIPSIKLIDPDTGDVSEETKVNYRMFHQTRVHTPARVVEILKESHEGQEVRKYRLEVEGYDIPLIIEEKFVN